MLKDNRLGQSKVLRKDFVQQLNIVCSLFTKNISINFYISIKLSQCFFCCNNIIIISWCENYFAARTYSALLVIKLFNNLPFAPTKYLTSDIIYSINVHSLYHRFGLPWVNICCSLRVTQCPSNTTLRIDISTFCLVGNCNLFILAIL